MFFCVHGNRAPPPFPRMGNLNTHDPLEEASPAIRCVCRSLCHALAFKSQDVKGVVYGNPLAKVPIRPHEVVCLTAKLISDSTPLILDVSKLVLEYSDTQKPYEAFHETTQWIMSQLTPPRTTVVIWLSPLQEVEETDTRVLMMHDPPTPLVRPAHGADVPDQHCDVIKVRIHSRIYFEEWLYSLAHFCATRGLDSCYVVAKDVPWLVLTRKHE